MFPQSQELDSLGLVIDSFAFGIDYPGAEDGIESLALQQKNRMTCRLSQLSRSRKDQVQKDL